ncbi:MAG TPA: transglutaminase domain-containing protein [Bacillales bacterium]|nr:transglutaminase domain-containing protein [Bacillales bacterium]
MQRADHWFMTLLLYTLGFLLFWEWLRPLAIITNTSNLSVFLMYTAFAFLLSYLQLPLWITTPAKILAMLYALHSLFFFNSFFDTTWLNYLWKDIGENVGFLIHAEWAQLSDFFRSLLFFVLLWLVSYLMHYWLIQARRVFLFFLVTVLYVTVIDTFTLYDATAAIVRTVIIGFILLGLLRFVKLQEEEELSARKARFPLTWAGAMAVLLFITTAVGFAAPKAPPQWPDPVPFIKSAATGYGNGTGGGEGITQRIGYGTDDSRLGGPFVFDDTPVFTAITEDERYWRVESKDLYTGKGWKLSDQGELVTVNLEEESAPGLYFNSVKTEEVHTSIKLADGREFPQLVYGGMVVDAKIPEEVQLMLNPQKDKFRMVQNGEKISLPSYELTVEVPEFSIDVLKKPAEDPEAIKERYLQLPESLPQRVRKLTKELTADADNRYAKAESVKDYLQSEEFTYDTKNVGVPGKNEDYVAQFLFETKSGYCDNFSSAMAVMLRTIGIPTRWVKGFTPGSYEKTLDDGTSVYKVTNANAHSWVEVYFPNSGWVPFEPTKGFIDSFNVVQLAEDPEEGSLDSNTNPETNEPTPAKPQEKMNQVRQTGSAGGKLTQISDGIVTPLRVIVIIIVILLLAAVIIYKTRKRWLPAVFRVLYLRKSGEGVLPEAYERLLKLLPMYGLTRNENITLREYAVSVDRELGTHEMKVLTANYEKVRYRGDRSREAWLESRELWESIIRKLTARKESGSTDAFRR